MAKIREVDIIEDLERVRKEILSGRENLEVNAAMWAWHIENGIKTIKELRDQVYHLRCIS